jgi:hypothetical protein
MARPQADLTRNTKYVIQLSEKKTDYYKNLNYTEGRNSIQVTLCDRRICVAEEFDEVIKE